MLKECSNCKAKIPFLDFYKNYLIGNRYKYTCTKCGAVHKAKISSILIFSAIFFVINMYLILTDTFSFSTNVILVILCIVVVEPLLLKYELKIKWNKNVRKNW